MENLIGRTLGGRYQIIELIGEGGMAEVYRAKHLQLDRFVAVKVMLEYLAREANFTARFEREAKLVAQLQHPHIIHVHDYEAIEAERLYYMVVELINGPSLATHLATLSDHGEQMPISEVVRITKDVASALSYAHNRGMIHRDIKPGNVLLDKGLRVVLTDFGVARMTSGGTQFTTSGSILGTPAYLPPEQGLGNTGDARSDLYSLGVMMYQMVTNKLPFYADTPIALVMQHINNLPEPPRVLNAELPPSLENIILRLMAKDPDARYQSADELIRDLEQGSSARVGMATVAAKGADATRAASIASPKLTETMTQPPTPTTAIATQAQSRKRSSIVGLALVAVFVVSLLLAGAAFIDSKFSGSVAVASSNTPTVAITPSEATPEMTTEVPTDITVGGVIETPVEVPSSTPTPEFCAVTNYSAEPVWLMSAPDIDSDLSGYKADPGGTISVIGVAGNTPDNQTWWQVLVNPDNNESGWASEFWVDIGGDCTQVPDLSTPAPVDASSGDEPTPTETPQESQ